MKKLTLATIVLLLGVVGTAIGQDVRYKNTVTFDSFHDSGEWIFSACRGLRPKHFHIELPCGSKNRAMPI